MNSTNNTEMFVENISLYYGENIFPAIKNISMKIYKNKVTALIGPSGCGKSTFLRTLNRMNEEVSSCHLEGEIFYNGKNIYSKKYDTYLLRQHVGMVFQKSTPFPKSIYNNVVYGPRLFGLKDKKKLDVVVEENLTRVGLWEEVKDRLHESAMGLSGGQQQRLCIARATAINPRILLMDEPASALDPIATQKIEDLISILKENYTIVIVTHNMHQAARVSDYTAFFYMGELIEFNRTKKLFTVPEKEKTEKYITGQFG